MATPKTPKTPAEMRQLYHTIVATLTDVQAQLAHFYDPAVYHTWYPTSHNTCRYVKELEVSRDMLTREMTQVADAYRTQFGEEIR